jgi:Flp pilus assembly protein TadB
VAGLILGLFLAKALFSILLTRALAHFLALIEARAARQVAKAAFGTGMSQARKYSREDIYFAVQAGSPAAFNSLLNYTGSLVAEGTLFLLVMIAFLVINPLAALATIIYFGLVAWIMQALIGNRMKKASEQVNEGTISANASIGDLSEAIKEATVLGKKDFFLDRIYESRV